MLKRLLNRMYDAKVKVISAIAAVVTMGKAFCTGAGQIASMIQKIMLLLFGFLEVYGIIYLVLGIKAVVGAMSDDGGGQDQQALSRGKGQIVRGVVCIVAAPIISLVTGINPLDQASIQSMFQ